jgi:hypothetical protein
MVRRENCKERIGVSSTIGKLCCIGVSLVHLGRSAGELRVSHHLE